MFYKRAIEKVRSDGLLSLLTSGIKYCSHSVSRSIRLHLIGDVVESHGIALDVTHPSIDAGLIIALAEENYEADEIAAIDSFLDPSTDVIDIGSCIGFTACYTNKKLTDNATHVAVEPNKDLKSVLERNREINDCSFEIEIAAYNTEASTVTLTVPDSLWGANLTREDGTGVTVPTADISSLIDVYELNTFSLIVDIEGAEIDLLQNELELLESQCKFIIIEFHDDKEHHQFHAEEIKDARQRLEQSTFERVSVEIGDVEVYRNENIK